MRILLDENLPHQLRRALGERDVATVAYTGWSGLKNGQLLRQAEDGGFDVLITGDRTLQYEQNMSGRRIAVISLSAQKWTILRNRMSAIEQAIDQAAPGSFTPVDCGTFSRGRRMAEEKGL